MTHAVTPRFIVLLLLLSFGLVVARPALAAKDSVPDWVRAAAQQTLPVYPSTTNAVVLLDDTMLTVSPDGRAVEHHRRVVKILRQAGREEATVVVPFDNESKLLSLHVWSIGLDGHEYTMKDSEVNEYGYPGAGGYFQDDRFKVANAPGRDPGGVVAYEAEQRVPGYMSEYDWRFQEDIPSVAESFTLELPPDFTYGALWAHAKPVAPIDLEHRRLRWELKDVAGIDLEHVPMHPSKRALAGRRQKALTDDKETVEREIKESVEHMLATGTEVKLLSLNNLNEYEEPLAATFRIKGPAGSATGKRLLVTGDVFEANAKPTFAHEKRDLFVSFPYRYSAHDEIRIIFPATFAVESVPQEGSFKLPKKAIYSLKTAADPHGLTINRDLYLAEILYKPADYPDLRNFYSNFEAKDQEPIILKMTAPASTGN